MFNVACFHYVLWCFRLTRTVEEAALQVVNLAISEKYEGCYQLLILFCVIF